MGTDIMIAAISQLASYLLPILGVVLFVFLIKVAIAGVETLRYLSSCFKEGSELLNNINNQALKFDDTLTNIASTSGKVSKLASPEGLKTLLSVLAAVKEAKAKTPKLKEKTKED